jgi:iron complex transport system permease protein
VVVVLLVVAALLSLAIGSAKIPLSTVWSALSGYDPTNPEHIAIVEKRLPRTVIGLVVGAALGLAGTLAQGVTRNPLADPGLLGVSQGASFGVVVALTVFGLVRPTQYMWFAFVGALLATGIVWLVASRGREGATPVKLALSGAAIAAAFGSLVAGVLIIDQQALDAMRFWQVGSLAGRGYDVLLPVLPVMLISAVMAACSGRTLNLFALGDDTARGLGLHVGRRRLLVGALIVLLAGGATAIAGPIAFLGLIVPHLVRLFSGGDYRWILSLSVPVSALVLLVADILARVVARPSELQVGIVLAIVGAPVFVAIVRRGRAAGL